MQYYWVYGLPLRSEFVLPELREISRAEAEDGPVAPVDLVRGTLPETLPGGQLWPGVSTFSYTRTSCLYQFDLIGGMLVEEGRRIVLDLKPGALMSDARSFLLGSGLGSIAHQRGMIPMHVGAALGPRGVVAFTGPSGAGKSTLTARMHEELGWPLLGDDVAIVDMGADGPTIEGGVLRMRLWSDALDRLGWPTDGMERDTHRTEKFLAPLRGKFTAGKYPLIGLYEIHPDCDTPPALLDAGFERFEILMNAIYRPFMVGVTGNTGHVQNVVGKVASTIAVWKGPRPDPGQIVDLLGAG